MPPGHRSTVSFGGDTPIGPEPETEDESEVVGGETQRSGTATGGINPGPLATTADFFFGGAELNMRGVHMDDIDTLMLYVALSSSIISHRTPFRQHCEDWQVKSEAFEPRTADLAMRSTDLPDGSPPQVSPGSVKSRSDLVVKRPNVLSVSTDSVRGPVWNPLPLVKDALVWYAESVSKKIAFHLHFIKGSL